MKKSKIYPELNLIILLLQSYLKRKDMTKEMNEYIFQNNISWDKFIKLAGMHRVETFLYLVISGLKLGNIFSVSAILQNSAFSENSAVNIPKDIVLQLFQKSMFNARQAINLYSENLRVAKLLKREKIPFTILKGPLFSEKYYCNPYIRYAGDIDVLISPEQLTDAVGILERNTYSYKTKIPFSRQIKYKHHLSLTNTKNSIHLELHWRPFIYNTLFNIDIAELAECNGIEKTKNKICSSGYQLIEEHLPFEEYFIYLCVHGSKHNWFRLFWLLDIAVIIENQDIDWEKLFKKAEYYKIERPVLEAILICVNFFKIKQPEFERSGQFIQKGRGKIDRSVNALVDISLKCIEQSCDITESGMLLKKFLLFINRLKHNLLLKKDFQHKLNTLKVHLTHSKDWELLPLPDALFPLYIFLRLFFFIYRNIKK